MWLKIASLNKIVKDSFLKKSLLISHILVVEIVCNFVDSNIDYGTNIDVAITFNVNGASTFFCDQVAVSAIHTISYTGVCP